MSGEPGENPDIPEPPSDDHTEEIPTSGPLQAAVLPDFDDDPPTQQVELDVLPSRYSILHAIGDVPGAELLRVKDKELGRTVAMRILARERATDMRQLARFKEVACRVAALQHPGVAAIYDVGELPDGRLYVTMAHTVGRALEVVAEEVRAAGGHPQHTSLVRRLVARFHRAVEVVAYAHARGVVHGALDGQAIVVGAHGAVWVQGWDAVGPRMTLSRDVEALGDLLAGFSDDAALVTLASRAQEARRGGMTVDDLSAGLAGWLYG